MEPASSRQADNEEAGSERKDRFELFIMSEAGKPIYSYTKREDTVTLMPLCSALMNYAHKTQKETLASMKTSDNLLISFTNRSPLIIVVINEISSSIDPIILVEQVEAQIISILTHKSLYSVFEERPTFDLKRLLYGSEKLIDATAGLVISLPRLDWPFTQAFLAVSSSGGSSSNLSQSSRSSQNQLLPTRPHRVLIPVVCVQPSIRDNLQSIINSVISANSKNMVFSLLFHIVKPASDDEEGHPKSDSTSSSSSLDEDSNSIEGMNFHLLTVCNHHNRHRLKIADIHIILALIHGSKAQLFSAESLWMPVCLPKFNQDAFLHSYIAFINDTQYCLAMFSVDREEFSICQTSRISIEEKLDSLLKEKKDKMFHQMTPLVHPILLDLQEKLTSNTLSEEETLKAQQQLQTYDSKLDLYHARQLQFLWYQTRKQVLWWQRSPKNPLNPVLYYITKKMLQSSLKTLWLKLADDTIFLGWHVPTFQLYAQFDSTITTNEATEVIQRITNWIKKEEDNFSLKDYR